MRCWRAKYVHDERACGFDSFAKTQGITHATARHFPARQLRVYALDPLTEELLKDDEIDYGDRAVGSRRACRWHDKSGGRRANRLQPSRVHSDSAARGNHSGQRQRWRHDHVQLSRHDDPDDGRVSAPFRMGSSSTARTEASRFSTARTSRAVRPRTMASMPRRLVISEVVTARSET